MFAESLLESNAHSTARTRQGWATAISISTQLLLLAGLASVSLLRPVDLPVGMKLMHFPAVTRASVPIISAHAEGRESRSAPGAPKAVFQVPSSSQLFFGKSLPYSDPVPAPLPLISSGTGNGDNPLGNALDRSGTGSAVRGPIASSKPTKLSHIDPGQLLLRTQPVYPAWAKQAGIEGQVVLTAIISKSGNIERLQVKSGHPLLAQGAENAIRQWRYRPYILNGEAVEVETQITVDFKLGK
jgi:periplasmic protein TonB